MDYDGTDQTRLTDNPANDGQPAPTSEGKKVTFASNRDGSNDVYVMDNNAGNQTRLTTAVARESEPLEPSFSPNGNKIVFVNNRDNLGNFEIYVMDSDGTDQTRLTNTLEASEVTPDFSPDGDR
jgi:Tol biopolymer transport system component